MFPSNNAIELSKHIQTQFTITCHFCDNKLFDNRFGQNISTQQFADYAEYKGWKILIEKPVCPNCLKESSTLIKS